VAAALETLAPGLFSWVARHPEWHPGDWGAEVVSFAARGDGGVLLLIDPQLPDGEQAEKVLAALDREVALKGTRAISIQITLGYHARSGEELWKRYRKGHPVTVYGHRAVLKRFGKAIRNDFTEIEEGAELPGGSVPLRIGKPRRQETPLWIPKHEAIAFGDAVVGVDGKARAWAHEKVDAKVERFYRERFNPTLEPLIDLGPERLLFTHGPSILSGGTKALRECIDLGPWYRAG
jgi:hypothetical protein